MEKENQQRAEQYCKQRSEKKKWQRFVAGLMVYALVATNGALLLPVEAMSTQVYCGMEEHVHSDDCYTLSPELLCQQEENMGHTHAVTCYASLICGMTVSEGHSHTDACYAEAALACGLEESEGHSHDETCMEEDVVICGLEVSEGHSHTHSCYTYERICAQEESAGHAHTLACCDMASLSCGMEEIERHSHSDSCYGENISVQTCDLKVHTHKLACFADSAADVETEEDWKNSFVQLMLTGNWAEDLAAVAATQLGYTESENNYQVEEDGVTTQGYTRYGAWLGDAYMENWSAAFVAFCLYYAEVENVPSYNGGSVSQWQNTLVNSGMTREGDAQVGDLVFLDDDGDGTADHAGIVTGTGGVIVGDVDGSVSRKTNPDFLTVIALPENSNAPEETTASTEESTDSTDDPANVPVFLGDGAPDNIVTGSCGTNVTYSLNPDTGVLTISGTGAMTNYSTAAPPPWDSYDADITSVVINSGVTSIGNYAFHNCSNLIGINIPDSITKIGDYAFYGCSSLTKMKLPQKLTSISQYTFYGCSGLTEINIPEEVTSIGKAAFYGCTGLSEIALPESVTSIGQYAFYGCTGLSEIVLPESVTTIGDHIFHACTNLERVEILGGINKISFEAFRGCTSLKSIVLPDTVTSIEGSAFYGCTALTSIDIPEAVTSIGSYAFYNCTTLTGIDIPDSLTSIGSYAFYNCTTLTSIDIPEAVISIEGSAFSGCTSLATVEFQENSSIKTIGTSVFRGCTSLKSIVLPDTVTSIGDSAFYGCTTLTSIDIPDGLTSIGKDAFYRCKNLESFVIPEEITYLSAELLRECTNLSEVRLDAANLPSDQVGSNVFVGTKNLKTIIIGDTVDTLSGSLLSDSNFTGVTLKFEPDNYFTLDADFTKGVTGTVLESLAAGEYYVDEYGVLYTLNSEDMTASLVYCPDDVEHYTIPASIPTEDGTGSYTLKIIRTASFSEAAALTTITFPENAPILVESLAFGGSGLTGVNDGMTELSAIKEALPEIIFEFYTFYNTGITDNVSNTTDESIILGSKGLFEVSITTDRLLEPVTGLGEYTYYTGQTPETRVNVASFSGEYDDVYVRVYVAFDQDDAYGAINQSEGEHTFEGHPCRIFKVTNNPNVYCVEIYPVANGQTANIPFTSSYANGPSDGGQAKIYAITLTEAEREALGDKAPTPGNYQLLTWITQTDTYTLTDGHTSHSGILLGGDGTQNSVIYPTASNALPFLFSVKPDVNASLPVGNDNIKSIEITTTTTLSEGLAWREEVLELLRTERGDGWRVYDYWGSQSKIQIKVNDTWIDFLNLVNTSSIKAATVELQIIEDAEGGAPQLQVKWRYDNTNAPAQDILAHTYTPSYASLYSVVVEDGYEFTYKDSFDIKMDAQAVFHYSHSEETLQVEASCTSTLQAAAFGMTTTLVKPEISHVYAGDAYPVTLQIQNNSAATAYMKDVYPTVEIPDAYYMSSEDLAAAFAADRSEDLIITINNANFCDPIYQSVTDQDGTTHTIHSDHVGTDNGYEQWDYSDCASHTAGTITLQKTADGIEVSNGSETKTAASAAEIQNVLDGWGFAVGSATTYTAVWNFGDLVLTGSEIMDLYVPTHAKDTFMRTAGDNRWFAAGDYYNFHGDYQFNDDTTVKYGAVYTLADKNGNYLNSAGEIVEANKAYKLNHVRSNTSFNAVWRDFTILLDTSVRNENGSYELSYNIETGDIMRYKMEVTHQGTATYDALPFVSCLKGTQSLLVPVEGNEALEGFTTETVDSTDYYVLNQDGTYYNVNVGGMQADRVVVGNGQTMIYWYLNEAPAEITPTIYTKITNSVNGSSYVDNDIYLSDHQTHRIWDHGVLYGSVPSPEKDIVVEKGVSPEKDRVVDRYSVGERDTITFRLTLISHAPAGYTTTSVGNQMWDSLPLTVADAAWEKDVNVSLTYADNAVVAYGSAGEGSEWSIDAWDDQKHQVLRWNEDFSITFTDKTYIYVTLTFPEGTAWENFVSLHGITRLENMFHLYFFEDSAFLDVRYVTEALIEKGVMSTYSKVGDPSVTNSSVLANYKDSLFNYINPGKQETYVSYFVSIYNEGAGRLYIDSIQDVLPRGFRYVNVVDNLNSSLYPNVKDASIKNVKSLNIASLLSVRISENATSDGKTRVTFQLTDTNPDKGLLYDSLLRKYYLEPGSHIFFVYNCLVGDVEETDDIATNRVALASYDYALQEIAVGDSDISSPYRTGTTPNDSNGCTVPTNVELAANGFAVDTGEDENWLMAEVTVTRDTIQPDIQKAVTAVTDIQGNAKESLQTANNTDILTWKVTATNNSYQEIQGYTLTDVMQYPYTFVDPDNNTTMEPYKTASKITYTLYDIKNAKTSYTITIVDRWIDDTGAEIIRIISPYNNKVVNITMDGEPMQVFFTQYSYAWVSFSKDLTNPDRPNEVLQITFPTRETTEDGKTYNAVIIPSMGRAELVVSTENRTNVYRNTVYYNTCCITPEQSFDASKVSIGTYAESEGMPSVQNSSFITVTSGYTTASRKRVTEVGEDTNTASSSDANNSIQIDSKDTLFRYSLEIEGTKPVAMDKLVLIDNLPQTDDHSTFLESEKRNSKFRVDLAKDPNFEVTVLDKDGNKTILQQDQYTVDFSTLTGPFTDEDWAGTTTWSESSQDARSIRLVILNDEAESIMPAGCTVTLSFTARVDEEMSTADLNGKTAWNSFGYSYTVGAEAYQAAPMNVGVSFPEVPTLKKELRDSSGNLHTAAKAESFRFLIYAGDAQQLSGLTEEEIAQALGETNYSVAEITVAAGASSEALSLNMLKLYNYSNGWVATNTDWVWTADSTYTIMELPVGNDRLYAFASLNGATDNSCTFTYSGSDPRLITAVNCRRTWQLVLTKVNTAEAKLEGAWFGLYSPDRNDGITAEQAAGFGLSPAPALTYTEDGITYYLMAVTKSNADGLIVWPNLVQMEYLVRELQAPNGYNLSVDAKVVMWQSESKEYPSEVSLEVVNESGYELPQTGGIGTTMFYILGGILVAASVVLPVTKKRMRAEK